MSHECALGEEKGGPRCETHHERCRNESKWLQAQGAHIHLVLRFVFFAEVHGIVLLNGRGFELRISLFAFAWRTYLMKLTNVSGG